MMLNLIKIIIIKNKKIYKIIYFRTSKHVLIIVVELNLVYKTLIIK